MRLLKTLFLFKIKKELEIKKIRSLEISILSVNDDFLR